MRSTDYSQVFTEPDSFPLLYHAHHSRHMEDIPFWLELARTTGGSVLELGCGTGRVLLPLAQAGVKVFGLERDPAMLAQLKNLLPAALQDRVYPIQADMVAFPFRYHFKLILLPCNTYSTLTSIERGRVLEQARSCLAPEGLFVISLPNPAQIKSLPLLGEPEVEETFPHPLTGNPVQVSSAWRRTVHEFILSWYYDHLLPDGRVERIVTEQSHALLRIEDYLAEFSLAGLEPVEILGDYDRSAYQRRSPDLIFVLKVVEKNRVEP